MGTFHSVREQHLQRYADDFDFPWHLCEKRVKIDGKWTKVGFTGSERVIEALKGIKGKRFMYRSYDQH